MSRPAGVKVTVVVEPSANGPDGVRSWDQAADTPRHYKVVEATNTTDPAIGSILSKAETDALIRKHVTVKVRQVR